jgi:hypothetical protein
MKMQTYKKIQVHILDGYHFDGTLECANQIYNNIKKLRGKDDASFKMNYDFIADKFIFEWGGYKIGKGDFVAIHENDFNAQEITIYTQEELNRFGFELQK